MGFDAAKTIELKVHLAKDDETGRWYIAESDIPGLRVEADTVHDLIRKVEDVAPELIELNSDEIIQAENALNELTLNIRNPARPYRIRGVSYGHDNA